MTRGNSTRVADCLNSQCWKHSTNFLVGSRGFLEIRETIRLIFTRVCFQFSGAIYTTEESQFLFDPRNREKSPERFLPCLEKIEENLRKFGELVQQDSRLSRTVTVSILNISNLDTKQAASLGEFLSPIFPFVVA